jgi:DNA helicase-2/ATP-dependent DNA helicase PcrA
MTSNKEFRTFGPPGCGKTTRLATKDIPAAVKRYGGDKVMVSSFTKAAATEIAGRQLIDDTGEEFFVDPDKVGTLHSLCFRSLKLTEDDMVMKHVDSWNDSHPAMAMTGSSSGDVENTLDEPFAGKVGDELLARVNIKRSKLIDQGDWSDEERRFYKKWTSWKTANGLFDFTDLIDEAITSYPIAPGNPRVIFVDEAQDLTPIQLKLVRMWGENTDWFILVGDDDQCLYNFAGADPNVFLYPEIDAKYKRVLDQSYRVPKRILDYANMIIGRISKREPKKYMPRIDHQTGRPAEGYVGSVTANFKRPLEAIDIAEDFIKSNPDKTVMFLTSCSYMLGHVKTELVNRALPFHNPYRRSRGDWNPLASGGKNRVMPKDLVYSFASTGPDGAYWTVEQFLKWAKHLKVGPDGLIRKQGKEGVEFLSELLAKTRKSGQSLEDAGLLSTRDVLSDILSPNACQQALDRNVEWLISNVGKARVKSMQYPMKVLENHGIDMLENTPRIIIGTIHSVKGGQADMVVLFPDISRNAAAQANEMNDWDNLHRLFYVGVTRAYEKLIVASPCAVGMRPFFVDLPMAEGFVGRC